MKLHVYRVLQTICTWLASWAFRAELEELRWWRSQIRPRFVPRHLPTIGSTVMGKTFTDAREAWDAASDAEEALARAASAEVRADRLERVLRTIAKRRTNKGAREDARRALRAD